MTLTHIRYRHFAHSHGLLARHAGGGGTDRGHAPAACCRTAPVNDERRSWRAVALGRRREWVAAGLPRSGITAAIGLRVEVFRSGRTGRNDQKTAMCVVRRNLGGMILPSIMMASTGSALLGLSVAESGETGPRKGVLQAPGSGPDGAKTLAKYEKSFGSTANHMASAVILQGFFGAGGRGVSHRGDAGGARTPPGMPVNGWWGRPPGAGPR